MQRKPRFLANEMGKHITVANLAIVVEEALRGLYIALITMETHPMDLLQFQKFLKFVETKIIVLLVDAKQQNI